MWSRIRPFLIMLSVALNLAFAGVWAAYALPSRSHARDQQRRAAGVWCPLNRRLGVSDAQWREIEPRLAKFQESAGAVCAQAVHARAELIDLIAATPPDTAAIHAKQEEIIRGQRRMQELVVENLLNEKAALTPAQQERLFGIMRQQAGCLGHGPMTGRAGATTCPGAEAESSGTRR
jgi:Spy/CpxP family protein refolding chaperone